MDILAVDKMQNGRVLINTAKKQYSISENVFFEVVKNKPKEISIKKSDKVKKVVDKLLNEGILISEKLEELIQSLKYRKEIDKLIEGEDSFNFMISLIKHNDYKHKTKIEELSQQREKFDKGTIERKKINNEILELSKKKDNIWIPLYKHLNPQKHEVKRVIKQTDRYEICKRQNWRCNICGTNIKYNEKNPIPYPVAHIDHIHPFSKKETYVNGEININESINLQALCPRCNLTKSKKEIN